MKKSIEFEKIINTYEVTTIDVTEVQFISPRVNNQKLLHACDMLSRNIDNYLIKR